METKTLFFKTGLSARLVYLYFLCTVLAFGQKHSGDIGQQNPEKYIFEDLKKGKNEQESSFRELFPVSPSKLSKSWNASATTFYRPLSATLNNGTRKFLFTYDETGKLLTETEANKSCTTYTYNQSGSVVSTLYQKFVSGNWQNIELKTNTFDENQNMTSLLSQKWLNNTWTNDYMTTYTYNSAGSPLVTVSAVWLNEAWTFKYRFTYTYNELNSILTSVSETFTNGVWLFSNKKIYTYDSWNRPTGLLGQVWTSGGWVNSTLDSNTYNSSGYKVAGIRLVWNNNQWTNYSLTDYSFDSLGRCLSILFQFWKTDRWVNQRWIGDDYDQNDNSICTIERVWSDSLSVWINQRKSTREFDAHNNSLMDKLERWSDSGWVEINRKLRTFDPNDNQMSERYEEMLNSMWVLSWTKEFIYDANDNCIHAAGFNRSGQPYAVPMVLRYNHGTNSLIYDAQTVDIIYQAFTGIEEKNDSEMSFSLSQNYPNPFNPETVIRFSLPEAGFVKGVVYDILGREVTTLLNGDMPAGNHQVKFDATGIASGVYVFRLEAGKYSSAIKMVINK